MKKPIPKVIVATVTQSPMNANRWLVTLTCGHEVWKTATRRPKAHRLPCHECANGAST